MISLKDVLKKFSKLLICYWDELSTLSKNDPSGSLKTDWLQANWELIVEGALYEEGIILEPYGDGADCNEASSRVLYPTRLPTHTLICRPLNDEPVYDILNNNELDVSQGEILFDRFVCLAEDGWYYESPPFDKVLAECGGKEVVLDFNSIDFQIRKN